MQNLEILNLFERNRNFAVIFRKYQNRNRKSTKFFETWRKPRVIPWFLSPVEVAIDCWSCWRGNIQRMRFFSFFPFKDRKQSFQLTQPCKIAKLGLESVTCGLYYKIHCSSQLKVRPVACTINIYDHRFYDRNDIGLYYNTLETIVIDDPSLS